MRALGLVVLLVSVSASADTSLDDVTRQSKALTWFERCAARLEGMRKRWARTHVEFATASVRIHKVNDNRDSVGLNMPDFWLEVTDNPDHAMPEDSMEGVKGWMQLVRNPPLDYPLLVRHLHPRSARIQTARPGVSLARWAAFSKEWIPLADACMRD